MTMDVSFGTIWEGIADALPEAVAVRTPDEAIGYGEFESRSARLASAIRDAGAGPGSKVACYLFNGPQYLETVFAAFKLGAVPVNANYRYRGQELTDLLTDADTEVLVYAGELSEAVRHAATRVPTLRLLIRVGDQDPQDPQDRPDGDQSGPPVLSYPAVQAGCPPLPRAPRPGTDQLFMYTGGTTGRPKGVIWAQRDLLHALTFATYVAMGKPAPGDLAAAVATAVELHREGRPRISLPVVPLMHGTGLFNTFGTLLTAGEVVFTGSRGLDPGAVWRTVARHRVTSMLIAGNAVARPLVDELVTAEDDGRRYDLSSLQTMISSGTTFTDDLKAALHDRCGVAIYDGLAASEGGPFAFAVTTGPQDLPGRFRPAPGTLVVDTEGRVLEPGDPRPGILAFGGALPLGYYKDPDRTASTYRSMHGGRYVVVGDYVSYQADGSLRFLGRGNAVINTGGEKVYPAEVEDAVLTHPDVADVAVVGEPDPQWGERIAAVLAARPGSVPPSIGELQDWLRPRLASYKLPRRITVVPELPRTPTGKLELSRVRQILDSSPE
jgi:acyl-CoA synthetase (AMP-forming)/AMP-acid ligase II